MVYAKRSRCAVTECPRGDEVFPTIKEGNLHMREAHGLPRVKWPRHENGLVLLDPSAHPRRKQGHAKDFAPTREEYGRLLEAARDELDRVAFRVLGEAGLRAGELLHVRPSWLRDGTLHIPYRDPETGWTAKTKGAARAIPLRAMCPEAWDLLEGTALPLEVSSVTLWKHVRKGGLRAGLSRRLFPHALRAYAATTWAYRLGSPFTLMSLMGWASLSVAMDYIASTGRGLEDAVEAWNRGANNGGHDGESAPYAGSPRWT